MTVYALVSALAVVLLIKKHFSPEEPVVSRGTSPLLVPLGIYAAAGVLSISLSAFPHSAYRALMSDAAGLIFFFLGIGIARQEFHTYIKTVIGSAVVVCLASLAMVWPRPGPLSGPLINPNVLGGFIILLLPSAFQLVRRETGPPRIFWLAMAVVLTVGAFLTRSPSCAAVVVFLLIVEITEDRPLFRRWAVALWIIGVGIWFFAGGGNELWRQDADRLVWWKTSLRMWLNNPIWGAGPGAFGEAYPGYRSTLWDQNSLYAHNWFLEMLSERGVAGAGGFLLWLLLLGRRVRAKNDVRASSLWFGIAAFLIYNLLHIGFSFPAVAWTFWFLGGMLWAMTAEGEETDGPLLPRRFRPVLIVGPAAVLILVGSFGLRVFRADQYAMRARYLLTKGDMVEAEQLVKRGLAWNPREPELYALQSQILTKSGRSAEADVSAQTAIRYFPTSADSHVLAGDIKLELGQPAAAMEHFAQAGRLMPLNILPWVRQAQLLESQGKLSESLAFYAQAEESIIKRSFAYGGLSNQTEMEKMRIVKDSMERVRGKIAASKR